MMPDFEIDPEKSPDSNLVYGLEALAAKFLAREPSNKNISLEDQALAELMPLLEGQFGVLTEGSTEAVWLWRRDREELLYVSPAFESIWGISRDELRNNPNRWINSIHPDDRKRMRAWQGHQLLKRVTEENADAEYRIVRPDGELRWVHDRVLPIRNELGEIVQCAGIAVDVTELKVTEEKLKQQQSVLLDLAIHRTEKHSALGVSLGHITTATAHCISADRAAVWTFNSDKSMLTCVELYDKSENVHSNGLTILAEDCPNYISELMGDRPIVSDDALRDVRTSDLVESYLKPFDVVSLLHTPIRVDGELRGVVCLDRVESPRQWVSADQSFANSVSDLVSRTIVEHEMRLEDKQRHALENEFAQAQKMESLGILAGGIAHDFNNLLQGILGNVDLARRVVPQESAAQKNLKAVSDTALRASELCDELLAYSGQGEIRFSNVDLAVTVREMAQLMEVAISKTCALNFDFGPRLPLIYADKTQIRQVILNLITNASEAVGQSPGSIYIRARVRHCEPLELKTPLEETPLPAGQYLVLEIEDTGCGMDLNVLQRMFEPFFTTKFTGRGLGLAATLGIMRAHNSALDIQSTPGEGTRVRLSFPALPDEASLPKKPTSQPPPLDTSGTILVVDDEKMVLMAAEGMLRNSGFGVILAESGREALRIMDERGPAITCVLLDLLMPEMSGEVVFAKLRELSADLPVIISSGYSQHQMCSVFPESEVAHFIKKPYDLDQLLRVIGEATARSPKT
jgi:PAS domain S-box-containing protein